MASSRPPPLSQQQQPTLATAAAAAAQPPPTSTGTQTAPPPSDSSVLRPNKRPLALNGISSTVEERCIDYICPVCFDLIREAHLTRCGHTFCYECIVTSIESLKRCPKCNSTLTSTTQIFPNYLLGELISKHKNRMQQRRVAPSLMPDDVMDLDRRVVVVDTQPNNQPGECLKQFITSESEKLALADVTVILEILQQRKQTLEAESTQAQNRLLHEFLAHLLRQKQEQSSYIAQEIGLIKTDMAEVRDILNGGNADSEMVPTTPPTPPTPVSKEVVQQQLLEDPISQNAVPLHQSEEGFNSFYTELPSVNYQSRKRRMYAHFDDFVQSYFSVRSQELHLAPDQPTATTRSHSRQGLDVFRENLVKFSRYNSLRPLATMHYSSDLQSSSTIVSTIVFDKDNEFFAIGGVTKRIKVFDYMAVVRDTVDIHYPSIEMTSSSKISCIAWNSYHKNILATSDYEGIVNIWDVNTGVRTQSLHEHEKRCWSVDFNEVDTRLIASGSDDARVKLWSTNDDRSIATLEAKANVCCVKFNPKSSCHLAFGSADHDVHYYDLRNMSKALCVFKGHKKAVSYVKFLNTEEIISASTDSQLKLWNVNSPPHCLRSFTGHVNEKNFVGLATDGDYVACGSEDNALYIYYKGLSKQLFNYNIDAGTSVVVGKSNDVNEFVSAVCWRKDCNVVLAANSKGLIKVFELI